MSLPEQRPDAAADEDEPAGAGWSSGQIYALALLTLIAMFNYLDRNLLGAVLPLVKAEMHVSDTVLGLVTGLVFILFYSLLGIPIASLADHRSRRNIIAAGFGFWSLMTILTGFCANVWQLAASRFLMGAGEACSLAPSNSMIADIFGKRGRGAALTILTASFGLQSILFLPPVGWIADHYGWRATFVAAGIPGLICAGLFFLTVKEPARTVTGKAREPVSLGAALRFLAGSPAFVLITLGGGCMGGAVYASTAWYTTFLVRVHHMSLTAIGAELGPPRGLVSGIGVLLAGLAADRMGRVDERWRAWTPAIACALLVPAQLLFSLSDATVGWVAGLMAVSFLLTAYQAPAYAAVIAIAPPRMHAVAISILAFTTGLIGQVCGPFLVGVLNDALHAQFGDAAIRYSLLTVGVCGGAGGLCFLAAAHYLDADSRRAAEAYGDAAVQ